MASYVSPNSVLARKEGACERMVWDAQTVGLEAFTNTICWVQDDLAQRVRQPRANPTWQNSAPTQPGAEFGANFIAQVSGRGIGPKVYWVRISVSYSYDMESTYLYRGEGGASTFVVG